MEMIALWILVSQLWGLPVNAVTVSFLPMQQAAISMSWKILLLLLMSDVYPAGQKPDTPQVCIDVCMQLGLCASPWLCVPSRRLKRALLSRCCPRTAGCQTWLTGKARLSDTSSCVTNHTAHSFVCAHMIIYEQWHLLTKREWIMWLLSSSVDGSINPGGE